eukprot:jgi/Chlat1/4773/Chrsp308S00823
MAGAKRGRPPKRVAEQKEQDKQEEEEAPCTSTGAKRVRACAHSNNEADDVGFIVGRSDEWEKPEQIFCDIASALTEDNTVSNTSRDDVKARLPAFVRRRGMLLIVDEADALGVEVAAGVLALGCSAGSKLVVVAAGNALALAEEKLREKVPRVHAVHFPAYTATQILAVLVHKFDTHNNTFDTTSPHTHVFEPAALQLCAKKVASSWGGDMRKALNACQLAREFSNNNPTSTTTVTMCSMAEALSKCVGYACPLMKTVKGLPSELQLALCSVVLQQRRCNNKSTLGDVEGLVQLGASRNSKQPKRITLRISDADVVLAFQGNTVFEQLLTSAPKTSD